ncbi:MAG: YcxB family protein [Devosia sp.]|uniref:YcxB family protein n=1 Tax=Devosia sp. TaxID=1871048 RepID=UPI0024C64DB2|nr:YcxB family protein [Devosia sp.]UYO00087.1 MAG: YcxB family protein [Devosia sp.]
MDRSTTFTMSKDDLMSAGRRAVFFSLSQRRTMIRLGLLWLAALIIVIGIFMLARPGRYDLLGILPIALLIATTAAVVAPTVLPLISLPMVIRRRFAQDATLRRPLTMSWTDTHFRAETEGLSNNLPWADYVKWAEGKEQFLFFLSDYNYQILPKRVLTEAQVTDIRAVIQAARD